MLAECDLVEAEEQAEESGNGNGYDDAEGVDP